MSTKYTANYLSDVRDLLQDNDSGNYRCTDAEINAHVQTAIRKFSQWIPYEQETLLPVVDSDREVDISSLSDLVWIRDPKGVEFYPDRDTDDDVRRWRNYTMWGDYLTMLTSFKPSVSESTLTGTLTFAATVDVTASGGAFLTEVSAGDFIKNSADTAFAKVRSVTDNDNLVLARTYGGTTGADSANSSLLRNYKEVVRIYWGGMHTVGASATTVKTEHEQLIIDGSAIYTQMGWLGTARDAMEAGISRLATANTQIALVTARITQAVNDLKAGRGYIGKEQAKANKAITDMLKDIDKAMGELATGSYYINRVNQGDNVPGGFATYAASQLGIGQSRLQQAQAFMAQDQPAGEFASEAAGELNAGLSYLSQASSYTSEGMGQLSAASAIFRNQLAKANSDLGLWLVELRRHATKRSFIEHSRAA